MSEHTYTILVIDDDQITRATLAALLENPNYRVEMAEDGIEGIEMATQIEPDVILLDVMMPRMNGYDVCKRIRSTPQIAEVPIIMITALDDLDAKLNGLVAGADDFLSKPFNSLELKIRLHTLRHVDRYRHLLNEREKLTEALAELSSKNAQLQALSRRALNAQEDERRRVAIELHDEIGQLITGLKLILERNGDDAVARLAEARAIANELMQRVREISLNLRPSVLDDFGLPAALTELFKRFTRQTKIVIHHNINPMDESRFDKEVEVAVFRLAQEAITNIARHAEVTEASVTWTVAPHHMQISIADSGKGFDFAHRDIGASTGLSGMAERVHMAGGRLTITSVPGKGAQICAEFDLKQAE
jgi:signal transduction histidine kinase